LKLVIVELNIRKVDHVYLENYTLETCYCRTKHKKSGSCIFVLRGLHFDEIDINKFCSEFDIEACGINLYLKNFNIYIMSIYRSPEGNFLQFLKKLNDILKYLFNPKIYIIICGDFNINYLVDNSNKQQLNSSLLSYNLSGIVKFPTIICNQTCSTINNIFIDYNKYNRFEYIPIINGISDHDTLLLLNYDIKTTFVNKQFTL
jgi:exonuclease III